MNLPAYIVRNANIWISTKEAVGLLPYNMRWLQKHKHRFKFRRKGKRNIEFELSSVLDQAASLFDADKLSKYS